MFFKKLSISIITTLLLSGMVSAQESKNVEFLNAPGGSKERPFSDGVKVGDLLILSGKVGISPETKKLVEGGFAAETKQILENIEKNLSDYDYEMKDVVKCTVILTDIKNFSEFNELYKEAFSYPYPARTTYAASLPLGAQIEIECMAAK